GGPLQYLHQLGGGHGSPRGDDFVRLARLLCEQAGAPFPDRAQSPEAEARSRKVEARPAALQSGFTYCEELLWGPGEKMAAVRSYLGARGFTEEHLRSLHAGYYPRVQHLRKKLLQAGHAEEDIDESGVAFEKMVGYAVFPWLDDRGRPLTLYGSWPE